jgi:hypothetical protein
VRIARETGAAIVPVMSRRVGNRHEIEISEPFVVPKTDDFEADMDAGFTRVVPALERGITDRLDQWVMFQRVWPSEPVPAVRVFPVGSPLESDLLEKVAKALPERPHPLPPSRERIRRRHGRAADTGADPASGS